MAEPPEPADGNPSTEDPGENKPWDELFVNNPDEYFGNTNSQKESRPKIGDPKEVALHTYVTDNKYNENRTVRYNMQQLALTSQRCRPSISGRWPQPQPLIAAISARSSRTQKSSLTQ